MSRWTYMRAVIDVSVGKLNVKLGNKEDMDRAQKQLESLFKDKITGAEGNAMVYYNFAPHVGLSSWNGDGTFTDYCGTCSVTIVGNLRMRELDETIAEFKELIRSVNADEDVYIEEWNSAGAIWTNDEDRFDIYPLLNEMCNEEECKA